MSADTGRKYAGRTPDERRADRRRRLLDTALDLFGSEGYAGVGIERLCATSGVTARHFYEEFGSREGVLRAAYDEIVEQGRVAVLDALAGVGDDADQAARTRAGIGAFVHHLLDDPRRARLACLEVVGVSPGLEAHRRAVLHLFAAVVEGQAARIGLVEPLGDRPFGLLSLALVGGVNELLIEWLSDPDRLPIDALVDDMVYLFVAVGRARELDGMPTRQEGR